MKRLWQKAARSGSSDLPGLTALDNTLDSSLEQNGPGYSIVDNSVPNLEVKVADQSLSGAVIGIDQAIKGGSVLNIPRGSAIRVSLIVVTLVTILTTLTVVIAGRNASRNDTATQQSQTYSISVQGKDARNGGFLSNETGDAVLINGSLITTGPLKIVDSSYTTILRPATLTKDQAIGIPNASGTICLDSNNCNFASRDQLNQLTAQVAQGVSDNQRLSRQLGQITTPTNSVSTIINGQAGAISVQGVTNQISVTTSSGAIVLATPQDIAPVSSPTFAGMLLNGNLSLTGTLALPLDCSALLNGGKLTTDAGGHIVCGSDVDSGGGGAVSTVGGTSGVLAMFTGAQTIADSILSQSLGAITIAGGTTVNGGLAADSLTLTAALAVANGGTGNTSFTSNGVVVGNAAGALIATSAPVTGQILLGNASGQPTFTTVSGDVSFSGAGVTTIQANSVALSVDTSGNYVADVIAGNGVNVSGGGTEGSTPTINVAYGSVANTAVQGSTSVTITAGTGLTGGGGIVLGAGGSASLNVAYGSVLGTAVQGSVQLTCPSGAGNLSGGGTTITLGSGGSCGNLSIVNNPTFSTSVTTPSLVLTGAGNNGTVQLANLGQATTYTIPDSGAGTATFCISTGNCATTGAAGGDLTGSYPNPTIAKLQGSDLSISALAAGHVLVYNNSNARWENHAVSSDISISETGVATIANSAVTSAKINDGTITGTDIANSTVANVNLVNSSLTVTAGTGLTGGGAASLGGSTTLHVGYGSSAGTAVEGNTSITVAAGSNLTGGGSITLGAGGTVTLDVTNSPNFSGTLVAQGATITVGAIAQQGSLVLNDGSANTGTVQTAALGQNTVFTLPDPGAGTATICLSTGNCAGSGGGVTTAGGTTNRLSKFTGSGTIGDSSISDDGSIVTVNGTANLVIQGGNATLGTTTQSGTLNISDGSSNTVSIAVAVFAADQTYTIPDVASSATFCMSTGNCVGGAGGAPNAAAYLVATLDGTLSNERALVAGSNISITDGGANANMTVATVQNPTFTTSVTTPLLQSSGALTLTSTAGQIIAVDAGTTIELQDSTNITGSLDASGTLTAGGSNAFQVNSSGAITAATGIISSGTVRFSGYNCSTNANGGKLTTDGSGNLICDDDNGGAGSAISGTGTSGVIPVFTGAQTIADSVITQSGSAITITGTLSITNALGVASGGTGASSLTSNGVLYGNGAGAIQATTAGTGGQVLIANGSGVPTFVSFSNDVTVSNTGAVTIANDSITSAKIDDGTITGTDIANATVANSNLVNSSVTVSAGNGLSGGGAVSLGGSTSLAVVYGSASNTAVQGNTGITVTAGSNLSGGGIITLGAGGTVTLDVASSPVFNGTLTVQGATATIGTAGQQGSLVVSDGSSNMGTLTVAALGQDTVYTLPDPGAGTATICLVGSASCGFAGSSGSGSYIQNQNASAQTSANFWIDGSGRVDGNLTVKGNTLLQPTADAANALEIKSSTGITGLIVDTSAASAPKIAVGAYTAGSTGGQFEITPYGLNRSGLVINGYNSGGSYGGNYIEVNSTYNPANPDVFRLQYNGTIAFSGGVLSTFGKTTASTSSTAMILRSGNVSGATSNSGTTTLQSGDSSTSGNTGVVTVTSGVATSGNSGNIVIDSGTASGTKGSITIGTANAPAVTIGNNSNTNNTVNIAAGTTGGINLQAKTTVTGDLIVSNNNASITGTSTGNTKLSVGGTVNASNTGSQYGIQNDVSFNPSGASLSNIYGMSNSTTVSGSALNIGQVSGIQTDVRTGAGYTGTITEATGMWVGQPVLSGTNKIATYNGVKISGNTDNGGNTTGTIENNQLRIGGNSTAAGVGGTLNNYGINLTVGSGNTSGTNNYGLYIQGSGGGSANSNYAIYSASSAASLLTGALSINGNVTLGDAAGDRLAINAQVSGGSPLVFQGATDDANAFTIAVQDPTANRTYTLPNSSATTDTFCLQTLANCGGGSGSYIQNQNASAQTSANFWISGSGQLDGGLTASGATINLNASSNNTTNINTGTSTGAVNIGTGTGAKTVSIGNSVNNTAVNIQAGSGTGAITMGTGGNTNFTIDTVGRAIFQATTVDNANFQIKSHDGSVVYYAFDETNGQNKFNGTVCIIGGGVCTQGTNSILTVQGGTFIGAGGSNTVLTTPVTSYGLNSRIAVDNYTYTSYQAGLSIGINASSDTTGRAIAVLDARTTTDNLPVIGIYSPDESSSAGLGWDGSNTTFKLKTQSLNTSSSNLTVTSGNTNGSGTATGNVTILSGFGNGTNNSTGNIIIDSGVKTGGGTAGAVTIGGTNASAITLGRTIGVPPSISIQGGTVNMVSSDGTNSTTFGFTGAQTAGNITYTLDRAATAGIYTICTSLASSCAGSTGPYVALQPGFPGTQQTGTVNVDNVKTSYIETNVTLDDIPGASAAYISAQATSNTNDQISGSFELTVAPAGASSKEYDGINSYVSSTSNNLTTAVLQGVQGYVSYDGTGTLGYSAGANFKTENKNTGTINYSDAATFGVNNLSTGTISNATGITIQNTINPSGTITTNTGIYIDNQTAGSTDYGLYIEGADTSAIFVNAGASRFQGNVTVATDSANAFRVETSVGTGLLIADTNAMQVDIHGSSYLGGAMTVVGTANINVTGSAATAVGNVTGNLTLQGGSVVNVSSSDGTNSTTLGFTGVQPAGNIIYNLNRAVTAGTYEICTTAATASCVSAYSGGGGTLQQAYGNDVDGSDSVISLTTVDDSIILRNPASGGTDSTYVLTIDQLSTGATGGLSIQSAGTGNLLLVTDTTATARNVLTIANGGATTFRNQTDSATAFQVKNAADSKNVLTVDTTSGYVGIGMMPTQELDVAGTIRAVHPSFVGDYLVLEGSSSNQFFSVNNNGWINYKPLSDSANAFNIREESGIYDIFSVDTSNARVSVGRGSPAATLHVEGSDVADVTVYIAGASTGHTADLLQVAKSDGATNVLSIAASGATLFQNNANSTTAFQVQNAAGARTLVIDTSSGTNGRVGIGLSSSALPSADLSFGSGVDRVINILAQTLSNTAGNNLTINSAAGNGTGSGGMLTLQAGASGSGVTGNAGSINVFGGDASSTNGFGGNLVLRAGYGTGSGDDGDINLGTLGEGNISIGSINAGLLQFQSGSLGGINLYTSSVSEGTVLRTNTNSINGFVVRNSTNDDALRIDTTNNWVIANAVESSQFITNKNNSHYHNAYWDGADVRYLSNGAAFDWNNDGTKLILASAASGTAGDVAATSNILEINNTGAVMYKNRTDSTTAFQLQNTSSASLFTADTSNNRIQIGSSTTDGTAVLLVVDSYNGASDPTGVEGASYYSSDKDTFRCYENGGWKDCSRASYEFADVTDEFLSGDKGANPIGALGWACWSDSGGCGSAGNNFTESGHPGLVLLSTGSTTSGDGTKLFLSSITPTDFDRATFIVTPRTTVSNNEMRVGLIEHDTWMVSPGNGAYFGYLGGGGNWFAVTRNGGSETVCDTGVAPVVGTWARMEIRRNGSGYYEFYINGTLACTNTTDLPGTTTKQDPTVMTVNASATESYIEVDYFSMRTKVLSR